jgi:glycosyltransferase involved in cell wall biosynthesis
VVIPVRNEVDFIAASIAGCLAQDYDGPLEVVVADGMSTDGTRDVVAGIAARNERVRLVDNPDRTAPSALNRAISASNGDIIVRCDAHAVLPPGYVGRAVALLAATGAANVGGVQRAVGTTVMSRAIAMAMSSRLGVGDARFRYGGRPGPVDTVYLGAFRRNALDAVGGFDETLVRNQDYELNYRLRTAGETVWFDPELEVNYTPRPTLDALARQYFDYGIGKRRMLRRHPGSLRWRQLAAPLLVATLALSVGAAAAGWWRVAVVTPGAYAAALIGGAVGQGIVRRDAAAILFPAAVATMHVAWGIGFLVESTGRGPQAAPR